MLDKFYFLIIVLLASLKYIFSVFFLSIVTEYLLLIVIMVFLHATSLSHIKKHVVAGCIAVAFTFCDLIQFQFFSVLSLVLTISAYALSYFILQFIVFLKKSSVDEHARLASYFCVFLLLCYLALSLHLNYTGFFFEVRPESADFIQLKYAQGKQELLPWHVDEWRDMNSAVTFARERYSLELLKTHFFKFPYFIFLSSLYALFGSYLPFAFVLIKAIVFSFIGLAIAGILYKITNSHVAALLGVVFFPLIKSNSAVTGSWFLIGHSFGILAALVLLYVLLSDFKFKRFILFSLLLLLFVFHITLFLAALVIILIAICVQFFERYLQYDVFRVGYFVIFFQLLFSGVAFALMYFLPKDLGDIWLSITSSEFFARIFTIYPTLLLPLWILVLAGVGILISAKASFRGPKIFLAVTACVFLFQWLIMDFNGFVMYTTANKVPYLGAIILVIFAVIGLHWIRFLVAKQIIHWKSLPKQSFTKQSKKTLENKLLSFSKNVSLLIICLAIIPGLINDYSDFGQVHKSIFLLQDMTDDEKLLLVNEAGKYDEPYLLADFFTRYTIPFFCRTCINDPNTALFYAKLLEEDRYNLKFIKTCGGINTDSRYAGFTHVILPLDNGCNLKLLKATDNYGLYKMR